MPNWLRMVVQFIKDAGRYGVASEIAAAILFVVTLVEHARDKTFSPWPFICLSFLLFCLGSFLAWLHQRNSNETLQGKVEQLQKQLGGYDTTSLLTSRSESSSGIGNDRFWDWAREGAGYCI